MGYFWTVINQRSDEIEMHRIRYCFDDSKSVYRKSTQMRKKQNIIIENNDDNDISMFVLMITDIPSILTIFSQFTVLHAKN